MFLFCKIYVFVTITTLSVKAIVILKKNMEKLNKSPSVQNHKSKNYHFYWPINFFCHKKLFTRNEFVVKNDKSCLKQFGQTMSYRLLLRKSTLRPHYVNIVFPKLANTLAAAAAIVKTHKRKSASPLPPPFVPPLNNKVWNMNDILYFSAVQYTKQ